MNKQGGLTSKCVVVSQPMYFPWIGIFQQIRLCDTFVYYDDVQFARGFFNRVQIKTEQGIRWLTVPLINWHRGQLINDVNIDNSKNWKGTHRELLKQAYLGATFGTEMLELVDEVFSNDYSSIGELSIASTEVLLNYFYELSSGKEFLRSSSIGVSGASSQRLVDICLELNAGKYLTGHGAKNYLAHDLFDDKGISVEYIDYELDKYPQLHGDFTPYVSLLDLIANCGREGLGYIRGKSVAWRDFVES